MTKLHVVSPCCPGYCNACQFLCLLSLLLLVPSFVNLGMALGFIAFCCLTNVIVGWCCWCCCRPRFFVVVTVDYVVTFVGDRHGVFQSDSSLLCRDRVCARVEDLPFGCWRFLCWNQLVHIGGSCFPWR